VREVLSGPARSCLDTSPTTSNSNRADGPGLSAQIHRTQASKATAAGARWVVNCRMADACSAAERRENDREDGASAVALEQELALMPPHDDLTYEANGDEDTCCDFAARHAFFRQTGLIRAGH
jgi:hypothetical protein